jgi:hypothetical protein
MPIHDWTRVSHGAFHDFHQGWLGTLRSRLNNGVLPRAYRARIEQHTPDGVPDVVALKLGTPPGDEPLPTDGLVAAALAPPKVRFTSEGDVYAGRRRTVAVRAIDGNRLVAMIEVVSPGNKSNQTAIQSFRRKVRRAVSRGVHVLIVDPFPPGRRDPRGVHPVIWADFGTTDFVPPPGQPLTLASYQAGPVPRAYVEAVGVGQPLPDMPLFLTPDDYVNVPLEATYSAAWDGLDWQTKQDLAG